MPIILKTVRVTLDEFTQIPGMDIRVRAPQGQFLLNRLIGGDDGLTVEIRGFDLGILRTLSGNVAEKMAEQRSIDEVLNLTLRTDSGENVALRNLVTTRASRAPLEINRKYQQRQVTVSGNVAGRPLGDVAQDLQVALDQIPRPDNYELLVAGNYEEQQESFRELVKALILSLLLVYMVLACQYESFRDPLIVMVATPMAGIGVLLTLWLTSTTLNLQSAIGCIMLGGIVVNNAILLVDQASRLRLDEKLPLNDAVLEAGRRRLRPILMTTLTTILGLMPLALGIGEGADAQAPLARAVVGGLTGSTLISLVLIPVVYTIFHRDAAEAAPKP